MLILQVTVNTSAGTEIDAPLHLNFKNKQWSIPNGRHRWNGIVHSDSGSFESKDNGVIWLLDGPHGQSGRFNPVILHRAPLCDSDSAHQSGSGRVYEPRDAAFRDCSIRWKVTGRKPSPPPATGELSAVRRRMMAVCREMFPQPHPALIYFTSQRRTAGSKVTNCGALPGMVMGRIPVIPPDKRGAFRLSTGQCLTSPMTMWDDFAQLVDKEKRPAKNTWVPFDGNRPQPGDIYILKKFDKPDFQHVGIIVSAEGSEWTTCDGGQSHPGQPDGFLGGFVKRNFLSSGEITGEMGSKARLKGWVNLDNLFDVARSAFPKDLI